MRVKYKIPYGEICLAIYMILIVIAFAVSHSAHAQKSYNNTSIDIEIATPRAVPTASEPLSKYTKGPHGLAKEFFDEARAYHDGSDRVQNFTLARQYYYKAAQLGHNDARVNLGYMAYRGQGGSKDYSEARYWYNQAARRGDVAAVENLAMMDQRRLGLSHVFNPAQVQAKNISNSISKPKTYPSIYAQQSRKKPRQSVATPHKRVVAKPKTQIKTALELTALPLAINMPLGFKTTYIDGTSFMSIWEHERFNLTGSEPIKTTKVVRVQSAVSGGNLSRMVLSEKGIKSFLTSLQNDTDFQAQRNTIYIGGGFLFIALMGLLWFVRKLRELIFKGSRQRFFNEFYERHRAELRETFVRFPEDERTYHHPELRWSVLLSVMMVRFAQKQNVAGEKTTAYARYLLDEKGEPKGISRHKAYKLVPALDKRIREDYRVFIDEKTRAATKHIILEKKAADMQKEQMFGVTNMPDCVPT
ncbi:MAG: tetratricopeptide repeat protein [Maricaulaceae bacterium]